MSANLLSLNIRDEQWRFK